MDGSQILPITGVIDSDSELRYTKVGNFRSARNIHNGLTRDGNNGAGENIRGFLNIPNPFLFNGENKCIGAVEDIKDGSIIYFVWNEFGYSGIYRYFRNKAPWLFGTVEKIMQIQYPNRYTSDNPNPLGFDPDHLITGIALLDDLLLWTDYHQRPRCINVKRANETGKRRQFKCYLNPVNFVTTEQTLYQFEFFAAGNPVPVHTFIADTNAGNAKDRIADIIDRSKRLNHSDFATFTGCEETLKIEMVQTGKYYVRCQEALFSQQPNFTELSLVIPENFYPDLDLALLLGGVPNYSLLSEDLIDQVPYTPLREPTALYKTDPDRQVNLVGNKVFQFRTNYKYKDFEESVYGAISNIAIPFGECYLSTAQTENNFIEVDFDDPRLGNKSLVWKIEHVEIAVREHENGFWKTAKILNPNEFVGLVHVYKFFNDEVYTPIAVEVSDKPFDSVPLLAKSLALANDRIFEGGIVEGYDKPCVNAKVNVNYLPVVKQKTYSIKFIVLIRNPIANPDGANYSACARRQVIHELQGNGDRVFGGLFGQAGSFFTNPALIKQTIPLAGFVGYLAGTDFFGISKQKYIDGLAHQNKDNSYWTNTSNFRKDVIIHAISSLATYGSIGQSGNPYGLSTTPDDITDQNGNPIADTFLGPATQPFDHRAFSFLQIDNIPEGEYVLRFSSHLTTTDDLSDSSRSYQRTSTNVLSACGTNDFEVKIRLGDNEVSYFNNGVPVFQSANGTCYMGATSIGDLAYNDFANGGLSNTTTIHGYLVDNITGAATDFADLMADQRIDKALAYVQYNYLAPNWNDIILNNPNFSSLNAALGPMPADHNGYFFYATRGPDFPTFQFLKFKSGQYDGTILNAFTIDNVAWNPGTNQYNTIVAIRNGNTNITNFSRTHITGRVATTTNINIGIPQILVVNTHGGFERTDSNGDFSIVAYTDSTDFFFNGNIRRIDTIIISNSNLVCTLDPASQIFVYDIDPISDNSLDPLAYDNTHDFNIDNPFLFEEVGEAITACAFKRGWDGYFGLIYLDEADRCCAVVTDEDALRTHILFYTEFNKAGVQENAGKPVLTWSIYNPPPEYAVKYRWVRTKNLQLDKYLQFAANDIWYAKRDSFLKADAVPIAQADFLVISLQSLVYYVTVQHPESTISFTFQAGDRIRFKFDSAGNLFNQYKDYEVTFSDDTVIALEKDFDFDMTGQVGLIFEVYTPRNRAESIIFYEFGETYEIKTAEFNGVRRKYHVGETQDQSYTSDLIEDPANVIPATGTFKTGDVYYRFREMEINYVAPVPPSPYPTTTTITRAIDDGSISDFFESNDQSIGTIRTSAIDIGRVERPTAIRFSNRYISNTKINGLCSFDGLNEKQFSTDYGLIVKLIMSKSQTLRAIFYNSYMVSMYLNQGILKEVNGSNLISISDDVIPKTHEEQRTFGSQNPESIVLNDEDDLFGVDRAIGVAWRSSGNQIVQISDYYRKQYWANFCKASREMNPTSTIPGVYDLYYDEVILTLSDVAQFHGEAPTTKMLLPDSFSATSTTHHIRLSIGPPYNILIFDQIFTTIAGVTWEQNVEIAAAINAGTASHGCTAVVDNDGYLVFTAPNNAYVYGGLTLLLHYFQPLVPQTLSFKLSDGKVMVGNGQIIRNLVGDTESFCKQKNGWVTNYDFKPEFYCRLRDEIVSFKNGELWLHGGSDQYNTFYGINYPSQVEPVTNSDNPKIKVFKVHRIKSSGQQWSGKRLEIEPFDGAPLGMVTEIPAPSYRLEEGDYWAKIKRDKNTPNVIDVNDAWVNGREMRGQAMKVLMESEGDEKTVIFETIITYFYSEKS